MNEELIKRIDAWLAGTGDEIAMPILRDCRAALLQSAPVRYVPMADAERNEMMARWYENHELPSISQYIESEVIRRAGLEVKE